MSDPHHFCHVCQQPVLLRDGDLICARCGSEFVEEIEMPQTTNVLQEFHDLVGSMMSELNGVATESNSVSTHEGTPRHSPIIVHVQQSNPGRGARLTPEGSERRTTHHGNEGRDIRSEIDVPTSSGSTGREDNVINRFLNQLLSNLLPQGAQVQFHMFHGPNGHNGILSATVGDYIWNEDQLDHIVTNLLNQFDGGAVPVDPQLLANLPTITVQKKHVDGDSYCTICMEKFILGKRVAELDCHHIFHSDCIIPWLTRHNTCPICRNAVDANKWPKKNPLDHLD